MGQRRLAAERLKSQSGADSDGAFDRRRRRENRVRRIQSLFEDAEPGGRRAQLGQVDHLQLQRRHRVANLQRLRDHALDRRALRLIVREPPTVRVFLAALRVELCRWSAIVRDRSLGIDRRVSS